MTIDLTETSYRLAYLLGKVGELQEIVHPMGDVALNEATDEFEFSRRQFNPASWTDQQKRHLTFFMEEILHQSAVLRENLLWEAADGFGGHLHNCDKIHLIPTPKFYNSVEDFEKMLDNPIHPFRKTEQVDIPPTWRQVLSSAAVSVYRIATLHDPKHARPTNFKELQQSKTGLREFFELLDEVHSIDISNKHRAGLGWDDTTLEITNEGDHSAPPEVTQEPVLGFHLLDPYSTQKVYDMPTVLSSIEIYMKWFFYASVALIQPHQTPLYQDTLMERMGYALQ